VLFKGTVQCTIPREGGYEWWYQSPGLAFVYNSINFVYIFFTSDAHDSSTPHEKIWRSSKRFLNPKGPRFSEIFLKNKRYRRRKQYLWIQTFMLPPPPPPLDSTVHRIITWYCRLYWYRGVTVLLPGWVIWNYWNYPCKFFSLDSWLVSALSTPNGDEGYKSSLDLNPITNSSIQLQCIQAIEAHIQPTKPQANPKRNIVCKSAPHQSQYCTYTWKKYLKRVALATKYFKVIPCSNPPSPPTHQNNCQ
jgi:hypothetical protein